MAASAPAWRHITFFEVAPVKDAHDLASTPAAFKSTPEISVVARSASGLLVSDIHGNAHLLDKDFEPIRSWIAHVGGRLTHMLERKGILVTLGEEDSVRYPILKVWDLEKVDKKTNSPLLLRSVKVQHGNRPHPVSTIALSSSLSHLAVGLGDGTVLLYRHFDQSIFSGSTSLTAVPKPRIVHDSPTEPITGLGFKEPTDDNYNLYLFIVTINRVLSYHAIGKGSGSAPAIVDEIGAGLGCSTMDWRGRDMVVARDEAIYVCGTETRGASYAYEGHKSSVHTHLNYLVIVSPPLTPSAGAASATVRNFARNASALGEEITKVTVFDLENKFVAYTGSFANGVREVVSQWGHIYILTSDGKLSRLDEKPTPEKLEMLYSKSWYVLALNMAKTQELDPASTATIHTRYGDHLYSKADYDGAMQQYVQTIGNLQPSYVIRKFLDAQRIHNLVTYLQELHTRGLANSDHTTLLLNTYTKLKDVSRLDSFIKTESRRGDQDNEELPFDLDTAIRVCRQAGYFEHASYLAKKYGRHEDFLRIQVEDAANYKAALAYLRKLGPEAAENNLARYGRAMLAALPDETTQLLIDICTGTKITPSDGPNEISAAAKRNSVLGSNYLSYLALNRIGPANADGTVPPLLPATAVRDGNREQPSAVPSRPDSPFLAAETAKSISVKRPSPRQYFSHFVDDMDHFVVFLEAVAVRRWNQSVGATGNGITNIAVPDDAKDSEREDQIAVWNTLLELYLTLPSLSEPRRGSSLKLSQANSSLAKAGRLLRSGAIPYDKTHALILCSTYSFTPGLIYLWEQMGMFEEILRFWMDKDGEGDTGASAQVIRHLNMYGPQHRNLYPLVLRFLTSTPELLTRHREELKGVLEVIESEKIMPPLGVVQVLSRNGVASVGLVKDWLLTRIKEARDGIQMDHSLTQSYRLETKEKLRQVAELSNPNNPKVFHVTKCSECNTQLDLPSVHFMCNHSYHSRCLQDHENECPKCVRAHGDILELRRNNESLANNHDQFLSDVAEDGFKAVAEAFGRGLLSVPRVGAAS